MTLRKVEPQGVVRIRAEPVRGAKPARSKDHGDRRFERPLRERERCAALLGVFHRLAKGAVWREMRPIAVDGGTRRLRQDRPLLKEATNASARPAAQHSSQGMERRESTPPRAQSLRHTRTVPPRTPNAAAVSSGA